MSGPGSGSKTTAALTDASTAALISAAVGAASAAAASSTSTNGLNIKSLIPITLDLQSSCFRRWRRLFRIVLGRYDLLPHIDSDTSNNNNPASVHADLTVVMWLNATLADDLLDTVVTDNPTARGIWTRIEGIFNANKPSRAVHLEAEFHGLNQGDLSISSYCHKLKDIADALADCDQPVGDRALVHKLIGGLGERFSTLKTVLPTLPQFPTYAEARAHLLREESSQAKSPPSSSTAASALVVTNSPAAASDGSAAPPPAATDRTTTSTNVSRGGRGGGHGGFGRGGRGRGRGGGRGRGTAPFQQPWFPPWGTPWGAPGGWRAPWTGATGPGVLGSRPPAGQAYNVQAQPTTMSAPLAGPSWDTAGLIAALHAASLHQPNPANGDWYMDTGASSHMTGDQGASQQERNHEVQ